jgi:hypothetical protein
VRHELSPSGRAWFAVVTDGQFDYMDYAEVDDLALEAWERMTFAGMVIDAPWLMPYSVREDWPTYQVQYVTR